MPPTPNRPGFAQREPLLLWTSILAGLYVLTGGAALGDVIGPRVTGLCVLVVAALQYGTATYLRGKVTPSSLVVERVTADTGAVVPGPAAHRKRVG